MSSEDNELMEWEGIDDEAMDDLSDEIAAETAGKYWKPKEGDNVIRILPKIKGAPLHLAKVWEHFIETPDGSKARVTCAKKMTGGRERCIFCDEADALSQSRNYLDKQAAKDLAPSFRIYFNIIDRKRPEQGALIYGAPKGVYDALENIRKDTSNGGDYTNPKEDGFDVIINRKGSGLKTEYTVRTARNDSPLGDLNLLKTRHNLEEFKLLLGTRQQRALKAGDKEAAMAPASSERALPSGSKRSGRRQRTAQDDLDEGTVIDVTSQEVDEEEAPL